MQLEHEKCLEIMFYSNAKIEPILVCNQSRATSVWEADKWRVHVNDRDCLERQNYVDYNASRKWMTIHHKENYAYILVRMQAID